MCQKSAGGSAGQKCLIMSEAGIRYQPEHPGTLATQRLVEGL